MYSIVTSECTAIFYIHIKTPRLLKYGYVVGGFFKYSDIDR